MSETKNVVIHGDSRDYIPKIKTPINCVITDPPFGMKYVSNSAVLPESRALNEEIIDDDDPVKAIEVFHGIMGKIIPKLAPQADIYIFTAWHVLDWWIPAVKRLNDVDESGDPFANAKNGIELKQMLLWDKGDPGQGDLVANWGCGHEVILYLKKGRRPIPWRRSGILRTTPDMTELEQEIESCRRRLMTLEAIQRGEPSDPVETGFIPQNRIPSGQNIHPTEKPVQLLEWLVRASTDPGDLIVDPYSGSGSTSVAAQKLGRNSLAFELKDLYVQRARERLSVMSFNFE